MTTTYNAPPGFEMNPEGMAAMCRTLSKDAERYAFAKTLEGQVITMETFNSHGAAALDKALDDAMYRDPD